VNILAERKFPYHYYNGNDVKILAIPSLLIDDDKMRKNDDAVNEIRRFVGATDDSI
jgi:hypothetical protein